MISLLKTISGLFKAFPKLADIFEDALFHFRNAQAEAHRIDKDNAVDNFIDNANRMSCDSVQWSGAMDEAPGGKGGSESITQFYKGSSEGDKSP